MRGGPKNANQENRHERLGLSDFQPVHGRILGVGWYHFRRNTTEEDYYVGGRRVPPFAVGLSVVATDVGGGFSIGLGGVGFLMGLSGSWLLFTGLLGAWLSALFVIPRLKIDRGFEDHADLSGLPAVSL